MSYPDDRFFHSVRFLLPGHEEFFKFPMKRADAERLSRVIHNLRQPEPGDGPWFFVFPSPVGLHVVISLSDLQLANILWDRPENVAPEFKAPTEEDERIKVYVRGRKVPYETDAAEPSDVVNVVDTLQDFYALDEPFLAFLDEDGEEVLFRPDQVMLMTVPEWYIVEGEIELDQEHKEAMAELETRASQEKASKQSRRKRVPPEPAAAGAQVQGGEQDDAS